MPLAPVVVGLGVVVFVVYVLAFSLAAGAKYADQNPPQFTARRAAPEANEVSDPT